MWITMNKEFRINVRQTRDDGWWRRRAKKKLWKERRFMSPQSKHLYSMCTIYFLQQWWCCCCCVHRADCTIGLKSAINWTTNLNKRTAWLNRRYGTKWDRMNLNGMITGLFFSLSLSFHSLFGWYWKIDFWSRSFLFWYKQKSRKKNFVCSNFIGFCARLPDVWFDDVCLGWWRKRLINFSVRKHLCIINYS